MAAELFHKVIVIVGGTSGIGLSAAHACLAAGAEGLVITGNQPESAESAQAALGPKAAVYVGDATLSDHTPAAIKLAVARHGRIDGLYHVAGGSGRRFGDGPLHAVTDAGIDYTLSINLGSVIRSNRAAVQQFLAQKTSGAILNLSSVLAWSPSPEFFATHVYAASKSAILGFTKSIAAYYASSDIRCNALAPGLVETPMSARTASDPNILRFIAAKQPLDHGRIANPTDLDGAAVFLLSAAAHFITGQVLAIDGGWSVSEGRSPMTS